MDELLVTRITSLAKLCANARVPNFVMAIIEKLADPLNAAVAPVNKIVPFPVFNNSGMTC